jgi:hypothetical protein
MVPRITRVVSRGGANVPKTSESVSRASDNVAKITKPVGKPAKPSQWATTLFRRSLKKSQRAATTCHQRAATSQRSPTLLPRGGQTVPMVASDDPGPTTSKPRERADERMLRKIVATTRPFVAMECGNVSRGRGQHRREVASTVTEAA